MEFREFGGADVPQAARLLAARHRRERAAFPALRAAFEDSARTEELLRGQLDEELAAGLGAWEGDELRGFLLSYIENDAVSGRSAVVSYESLALAPGESPELFRALYARLAARWLALGARQHTVFVPAGDAAVVDAWLRLSFAFEQVYGVTALTAAAASPGAELIRQAGAADAPALADVSGLIYGYQAGAPVYAAALPERMAKLREGYAGLPGDESCIVLLACEGERLLGFQCASTEGEDDMMFFPEKGAEISICATVEERRGSGVGTRLTGAMFERLRAEGFENALADWRVANLSSSVFWPARGFRPVAYRMCRTIDERVYWASGRGVG